MKKRILLIWLTMAAGFGLGGTWAKANMSYNGGYYTNLCGGGTAANSYSCDNGCTPTSGMCRSNNAGAVRYICSGKWTGCLESEEWGNTAQIGQIECGKTVQLSLYDKKCRQDDGSWDASCRLQGYMVWYSGDCWGNGTPAPQVSSTVTPRTTATPVPTQGRSSPAPTQRPTLVPTSTIKPTVTLTPTSAAICNKSCVMDSECGAGFMCAAGVCRNPVCTTNNTCFCDVATAASLGNGKGKGDSPETGIEAWWGVAGMLALAAAGWKMTRVADKLW